MLAEAGPCEGTSWPRWPTLPRDLCVQNAFGCEARQSRAFRSGWSPHPSLAPAGSVQAAAVTGSHSKSVLGEHLTQLSCDASVCEEARLTYTDIDEGEVYVREKGETDPGRNCCVAAPNIVETLSEPLTNTTIVNGYLYNWIASRTGPQGAPFILPGKYSGIDPPSLGREGRRLSAPTANGCLCVWTAASYKASLPSHVLVQSGTYPP